MCNISPPLLDCQDNKYLKRNDLNFEGTFHLAGVHVIHLEEWQHVRAAKLIPRVAKHDTAYSQLSSPHACAEYFGCHYNYFTNQVQRTFCFVSLLFTHFLPFQGVLWHTQAMFSLSIKGSPDKVSRKHLSTVPEHITLTVCLLENNSCWDSWRLSLFIFKKTWQVSYIIHWHTAAGSVEESLQHREN